MAILPCQFSQQMSVATDSPVNPSSSDDDDFAALIEAELESDSSDDSPDIVDVDSIEDNDDDVAHQDRIKRRKVIVDEVSTSYSGGVIMDSCPHRHPGFFRDMCVRCGQRVENVGGVAFGYIHKDLRLGSDEISRLRNADVRSLLRRKKLYLKFQKAAYFDWIKSA